MKNEIKSRLQEVLIYYGFTKGKDNWNCLENRHKDPKNNLTVTGNIFCCHCGLQGDVFNLISEMEGLNIIKDFSKIINKGKEILSLENKLKYSNYNNSTNINKNNNNKKYFKIDLAETIIKYYNENFQKNKNRYKYFYNRGLSKDIIDKYKIIIGNPYKIIPSEYLPNIKNLNLYEYILPVWENGKVVNCILRLNDWKFRYYNSNLCINQSQTKSINLKNVELKIFNSDYLKSSNKLIFICEGWADSLTFETLGFKSISINSVNMFNKFVNLVKENIDTCKNTKFVIAFDSDKYGIKFSKILKKILREELNIDAYRLQIGYKNVKDVNEYFNYDKQAFIKSLKNIINIIEESK